MTVYAYELAVPVFVARGLATTRRLYAFDGVSSATVTGSYVLYDASGTSQATGTVTAGAVAVTPPANMQIGSGAYEVWTLSSPEVRQIRRAVYVTTSFDSGSHLVTSADLVAWYPWLSLSYPGAQTSYESQITTGHSRVLRDLIARSRLSQPGTVVDVWDPEVLHPCVAHAAASSVLRLGASLTGAPQLAVLADWHEEQYRDAWARVPIAWSTDGDGVAEAGPDRMPPGGFPAPGPAAGGSV